jgi:hypothetical protein
MVNLSLFSNKETYNPTLGYLNQFSEKEIKCITNVHDSYSSLLSQKDYEQISSNYNYYLKLFSILQSIKKSDPTLAFLILIIKDILTGSVNSLTLYTQSVYLKLDINRLKEKIAEILSNKNFTTSLSNTQGSFGMTKQIVLSPLLSQYIYLYGLPKYGVGLDPFKLAFIKKLLDLV